MPLIQDPDLLVVGTQLTLDTTAKTFSLIATGNLNAKDGVTGQALYSKFVELWTTSTYNKYPFPAYVIGDPRAGMFVFGFDGAVYNGWKPANDTTRQMLRNIGWSEYSNLGVLNRQYVGVVSLGDINSGAQLYYQKEPGGTAINTTFTDELNEGLQIYGDATNGNFDHRNYFKLFCREYGYKYADASITTIGETSTGAWKIGLPVKNEADIKIKANDAAMSGTPYTGITVTYYGTNQNRTIGGIQYPFRVIINGNNATAEEIYTKVQYLLRQNSDIDSGAGTVIGKTADALLYFVGDTLYTTTGVYIDNYNANDINRIKFLDQNGVERAEPFTAAGTINFNAFLTQGGNGYYRMYFTTNPAGNYGSATAVTVKDAANADITGTITSGSIPFTFAYDANVQGGRTAATDAQVTVVAGNPGSAKPVVTTYTITKSVGQGITVTAEQDRGYSNL